MIAALRGAVYEALKREEDCLAMFERLEGESDDSVFKGFLKFMADDTKKDIHMLKHLNLHSIIKFGLTIKFEAPKVNIDEKLISGIQDKAAAKESLKIAIDQMKTNIEYYEHIAEHSIFPEVKRLFRIIGDKELEDMSRLKALNDMLE